VTSALWLRDLGAYSVQVALLVAAGALLFRLFSLRASRATLAYWQVLLAVCLVLPVCQPWLPSAARSDTAVTIGVGVEDGAVGAAVPRRWTLPRLSETAVLATLGAGMAVRALWLGLGLWTLRRLRRRASLLSPEPPAAEGARRETGVRAALYISSHTDTPVTFGLRRPVVLLPPSVLEMDAQDQQTILTHELLHVKRRDCLWSVLEEGVRALLWFHPAVWWLIGRIHLTREQVVDQTVVGLTRSRERYVQALLAVARAKTQARLVPAPLFLRRGLLRKRVTELFRETPMTKRRLLSCLAVSAGLLALVAGAAVRLFPLEAARAAGLAVTAGEPRTEGDKTERRTTAEQLEREIVELKKALEDPQASAEEKEHWKHQLAERKELLGKMSDYIYTVSYHDGTTYRTKSVRVDEKVRGDKNEVERLEQLLKRMEIEKAVADRSLSAERRAELERKIEEVRVRMEQAEQGVPGGIPSGGSDGTVGNIRVFHGKLAAERPIDGTLMQIRTERVSAEFLKSLRDRLEVQIGDHVTDEVAARVREAVSGVDDRYRAVFHRFDDGVILVIVGP
jgi:beta-lactamase regulating signal transducer with metallopeptidase domain